MEQTLQNEGDTIRSFKTRKRKLLALIFLNQFAGPQHD